MRRRIVIALSIVMIWGKELNAQDLYYEGFETFTNGTTQDTGDFGWDRDISGTFADYFAVTNNGSNKYFLGQDTDGQAKWFSELVDISAYPLGVRVHVDIGEIGGLEFSDYIGIYYNTDGGEGADVTIAEVNNDFGNTFIEQVSDVITGTAIQIVVIMRSNANDEGHAIDNVRIVAEGGSPMYSIANGDYHDPDNWSTLSYLGLSCACIPNENTSVNIGNSRNIDITEAAYTNDMIIEGNASLSYDAGDAYLWLADNADLTVNGGTLDRNGQTGAYVVFQNNSSTSNLNAQTSTIDVERIYMYGSNNLTVTGPGDIDADQFVLLGSGSVTNNSTGNLNTDVYFSTAATTFTNNGTVNMSGNLTFDNDNQTYTNNGTTTIGQDVVLNVGADNNTITNIGTITIQDDIAINNSDLIINNSGIINQTGDFIGIDNGSDFNNLNGSTWNWLGVSYDADLPTILDCSNNSNTFDYQGTNQPVIPINYYHVVFSNSGTKTTQGNLDVNGDLTITDNAQLNVDNGDDNITLAGNWIVSSINADPFVEGNTSETVTFDGNGTQSVSHSSAESFRNITVDKVAGAVQPAVDLEVSGVLALTAGNIELGNVNLTIGSSGSITGGSGSSFVVTDNSGSLYQQGLGLGGRTGDITFPVGALSTDYTPIILNNDAGTADDFDIRVGQGVYDGGTSGNVQTSSVINRTWYISEGAAGGTSATITFQWNASNETSSFDRSNMNFIHWDGSVWENIGNTSAMGTGPYMATVTGVSDFSPFAIEDGGGPLPVELVMFKAEYRDGDVDLYWETASELNNDYFTIEKSKDLSNYETVQVVEGQGTTNAVTSYGMTDRRPYSGVSYYRLRQTDFDGTVSYSAPVRVENHTTQLNLKLYPVPNNGEVISLVLTGLDADLTSQVRVMDALGKVIITQALQIEQTFGTEKQLQFDKKLAPGVYTMIVDLPKPLIKQFLVK